ncbi:MAG TPA: hypothetical protein VFD00_11855, partial [Thermoclostridium sp.]|nr:hypothetical protein [Thermoclostridium sp.]
MNNQDAIKRLKNIVEYWTCRPTEIEAAKLAISALEKQIPKKPLDIKMLFVPHSTLIKSVYGKCPICDTVQADDEYCQHCGQALDWGIRMNKQEIEKAIETLKDMKGVFDTRGHKQYSLSALDLAISSLEKQIPKKPRAKHYEDEREPAYIKYKCPNGCGSRYRLLDNVEKYCMNCGQAIDWE